jgi:hypothetical protein
VRKLLQLLNDEAPREATHLRGGEHPVRSESKIGYRARAGADGAIAKVVFDKCAAVTNEHVPRKLEISPAEISIDWIHLSPDAARTDCVVQALQREDEFYAHQCRPKLLGNVEAGSPQAANLLSRDLQRPGYNIEPPDDAIVECPEKLDRIVTFTHEGIVQERFKLHWRDPGDVIRIVPSIPSRICCQILPCEYVNLRVNHRRYAVVSLRPEPDSRALGVLPASTDGYDGQPQQRCARALA